MGVFVADFVPQAVKYTFVVNAKVSQKSHADIFTVPDFTL